MHGTLAPDESKTGATIPPDAPLARDPWCQSLTGKAIDMLRPISTGVDFREIADVLAQLNRYAGNAVKQVSVGLHTLIACDAAPLLLKPWVLLHDAHEARIGDITTPTREALMQIADGEFGDLGGHVVAWSIKELKRRHDIAIHIAAGLKLPSEAQQRGIDAADLVALQTERRDFLRPSARPWTADLAGIQPLNRVYRLRAAPDVADELHARFQSYLPAFSGYRPAQYDPAGVSEGIS